MKTIAEVLASHYVGPLNDGGYFCFHCGDFKDFDEATAHQAISLANAGYGKARAASAGALRDAAEELAKLPYIRPNGEGREEYERLLAIRRGNTDAWLRDRAKALETS